MPETGRPRGSVVEPPSLDLERPLAPTLEAGCPHMAILLESMDDYWRALGSFYALGLRRGGWLFHRALPGQADAEREALRDAGLDVARLEDEGRFELCELPVQDPPESWAQPWLPVLERQLERGFEAVWWSRFPIGPEAELYRLALVYDRYWEACFHGRKAVSLCVYVVGGLPSEERSRRTSDLREIHDATLVLSGDALDVLPRR